MPYEPGELKELEEILKRIDEDRKAQLSKATPIPPKTGQAETSAPITPSRSTVNPELRVPSSAPPSSPSTPSKPPASTSSPSTPKKPLGAPPKQTASYGVSADGMLIKPQKTEQKTKQELDVGPADFDINFDFETAYRNVPENKPLRIRREKRTGIVGGLLFATFIICFSLVLASLMWMATVDVLGFGAEDEQVNVTVRPGFTMEEVTDMLYEAGLIRYRWLFNLFADYSEAEARISPGHYILNKNYDYRALVQGMTARAGIREERTVTIPEGFTLAQIFTLLGDYGITPAADLWEAAANHNFNFHFLDEETLGDELRLEGFLFPETYNFFMGSTPQQAINRMLREFNRRFTEEMIERAEAMGMSVRDIIIIASIIERETGSHEESPRIAAVIYNRLNNPDTFPRLEIDATIHYAIAGTGQTFSTSLDSPFNTYLHPGLPPGPISNPGMDSIRAALYPDSTDEFFYALNLEGTHNFFRTYAEHSAFVASDQYGG